MIDHGQMLSVLARADTARLKTFAETLIAGLGEIEVRHSRTGLVMLPMRDTAGGTAFHLGEVLMSEAHTDLSALFVIIFVTVIVIDYGSEKLRHRVIGLERTP
jgi:alpha-D-ribose 1-methylphosphonate 5-triphosphate synthase subunit PhnG